MQQQEVIPIFIGFDERETVAYHALVQSIIEYSSLPVAFTPIHLNHIKHIFKRERNELQSTDFSFSRFLVPYLSQYQGWSIFMDCDMLLRDDIAKLWNLRDEAYHVMCVKHDHNPDESVKFLNQQQTRYQKKNWSSVMLFNNQKCQALSLDYVNQRSGLELHQFKWLDNDEQIGALPIEWNHLVAYNPPNDKAKLLHYTSGGPYFKEYEDCEYHEDWFHMHQRMNTPLN
jgi:lipopolysaccharide biosynthesis glycosyltransferase